MVRAGSPRVAMSLRRGFVVVFLFLEVVVSQELYEGDICKTLRGKQWKCRQIRQCPKAMQLLQSGGRPEVCSYAGIEPVVCCEPTSQTSSPPTPVRPTTPTPVRPKPQPVPTAGSKSLQMCKEYGKNVFISLGDWDFGGGDQKIDTCNQLDTLIVGGRDARPREFPHMAQVGYGNSEKNIRWKCGGSLISKNFVLSAAHCTKVYGLPAKWIRLGEYNINTKNDEASGDAKPEVIQISQRIDHPQYRAPNSENDISLYRLARDVEFNEYIRPVCLQPATFISQPYATATGWGNKEFGGKNSDVLQKVNVTLISSRECSRYYSANAETLPRGIRGDSMLCAGDTFSHKDSCQGDSGGPLQVLHPDVYCSYNLVGIVSFGEGCGSKPGVYTRVSHFVPWIEQIVWQ